MKLQGPTGIGLIVAAALILVIAGWYYVRHLTGDAVADQLHAEMSKMPPRTSPMSPAMIEEMKKRKSSGDTHSMPVVR